MSSTTRICSAFVAVLAATLIARGQPAPSTPDLATAPAASITPLDPNLPTIFIAGDSTAAKDNGQPTQGWGVPFAAYFDPAKVNIANRARGGRSSRTFITEGLWDRLLADVKAGDFVLIQFGHNDGGAINEEPPGSTRPLRARGSLPGVGEETTEIDNVLTQQHEIVHTFGWYVRKMIADVRAKNATPLVLSLTVRNLWTDGRIERGSGRFRQWDREIAETAGTAFVDLSRIVADRYQELGATKVREFFGNDYAHTNPIGADFNAAAVVAGLKGLRKSAFTPLLSAKGEAVAADHIGWLNLPEPADAALPTLLIVGDSTVRNGRGDGADGLWGWGDPLAGLLDPAKVNVVNRAVGGTSSRTFGTLGYWRLALALVKPGDVVLIQFGENDTSPVNDDRRARGTLAGIGEETEEIDNLLTKQHEVVHTFGWYLRQMIVDTRAAGATPILVTPVVTNRWVDGRVVPGPSHGQYATWMRELALRDGVALLDLTAAIAQEYDRRGQVAVQLLFKESDHTHTNAEGAKLNAQLVAAGLRTLPALPLAEWTTTAVTE